MYLQGYGVPQDATVAVQWYRRAAEQGFAAAQANLGVMYYGGRGVPQDFTVAFQWYRRAAEQGHAIAQFNLSQKKIAAILFHVASSFESFEIEPFRFGQYFRGYSLLPAGSPAYNAVLRLAEAMEAIQY